MAFHQRQQKTKYYLPTWWYWVVFQKLALLIATHRVCYVTWCWKKLRSNAGLLVISNVVNLSGILNGFFLLMESNTEVLASLQLYNHKYLPPSDCSGGGVNWFLGRLVPPWPPSCYAPVYLVFCYPEKRTRSGTFTYLEVESWYFSLLCSSFLGRYLHVSST